MIINLPELMTPRSLIESEIHEIPSIIFPEDFNSFDDLLLVREEIRNLLLVPIKSDEMHKKYHSYDKEKLIGTIDFNESNLLLMPNQFPYLLPEDTSQNIIWIKDGTSEAEVQVFIYNRILEIEKDIIMFERPFNVKTKMVKGSFPFIRHIHFWYKVF